MSLFKNIFRKETKREKTPLARIRISQSNIQTFPKFEFMLYEGKIKFDSHGRLRYLHGAPVGDMVLTGFDKNGSPTYKESADEWFDPNSTIADQFIWPE